MSAANLNSILNVRRQKRWNGSIVPRWSAIGGSWRRERSRSRVTSGRTLDIESFRNDSRKGRMVKEFLRSNLASDAIALSDFVSY